ncbi:DUF6314 family protein [Winogradskya humida]|uniref:DUF6314 family protein n=1 Tax=Winogradskya humida TaxID=113566 RepID=UPI001942932C|nr:DUF6314 family protein [Actinoplanes humidus]
MVSGSVQEVPAEVTPLQFLHGEWAVRRDITDRRSGHTGLFTGRASFEWDAGTLRYAEEGELRFAEHRGPASRRLVYVAGAGSAVGVRFADGRPFYDLDLRDQRWGADHLCGADLYTVTGLITGPDSFVETWHAGGPGKDYDLVTAYQRL